MLPATAHNFKFSFIPSSKREFLLLHFKKSFEVDPRIVFYRYFSSYANSEEMRTAGLFGLIGIAFVLIFGYRLKPPEKDE